MGCAIEIIKETVSQFWSQRPFHPQTESTNHNINHTEIKTRSCELCYQTLFMNECVVKEVS